MLTQGIILVVLHEFEHLLQFSFPTLPPFGEGLSLLSPIKLGSLFVVHLSLRSDFPQALGIACVLPSCTLALILSDPARTVLGR